MSDNKGVIINVYVESHKKHDHPMKKIDQNALYYKPRVSQTRGYDRRAQLLAYAQELRHANVQHYFMKNSRPKHKKWRWIPAPMQKIKLLFSRFDGTNKGWKYEPIITEDYGDREGSSSKGRRNSCFCTKLKRFFKKLCSCRHGAC